jgi:phage FluMu protein Com
MVFIDVRCQHCTKLLCRVSKDFYGLVQIKCQHQDCKKVNTVSLAIILKQMQDEPAILQFPTRTSVQ